MFRVIPRIPTCRLLVRNHNFFRINHNFFRRNYSRYSIGIDQFPIIWCVAMGSFGAAGGIYGYIYLYNNENRIESTILGIAVGICCGLFWPITVLTAITVNASKLFESMK